MSQTITLEEFKKVVEATIVIQGEDATITLGTPRHLLDTAQGNPPDQPERRLI